MSTQITGKQQGVIKNNNIEQTVYSGFQKTQKRLEPGKSAITMAGGRAYPIMIKEVLAGEWISSWKMENLTRLLTPLVPTLDKTFLTVQAYFVPHTRVWESAEEALAGKTGAKFRNSKKLTIPTGIVKEVNTGYFPFKNTLASRYGIYNKSTNTTINTLLLRGYRAIYNDYLINKDYEIPKVEWNTDQITAAEQTAIDAYNADNQNNEAGSWLNENVYKIEAAPTRKSYLTNVKSRIVETNVVNQNNSIQDLGTATRQTLLDWQTQFMDLKQRQDNTNKNDWDIIAEMGGTAPAIDDEVQFLGEVEYPMNYQQITQSAPEINSSSPLGTTGSFSFTNASGELFNHFHAKQHGFIHILAWVNMEKVYEASTPKELLKSDVTDIYRPGLAKKEVQFLLKKEVANNGAGGTSETTIALQPAWAEYKRLPSFTSGDMRSEILEPIGPYPQSVSNSQWHNFINLESDAQINAEYFKDEISINNRIARNNILNINFINFEWDADPFMNMSEHVVTTSLPIDRAVLEQKEKAEQKG